MKKLIIFKNLACSIFSIMFFILSAGADAYGGDIGFVDMNRILTEAQDALDVRDLLKLEEERHGARLKNRKELMSNIINRRLKNEYTVLGYEYEESLMALIDIRDDYQSLEDLIDLKEIELIQGLFRKVIDVVKEAAGRKGYRYVFDINESRIVFKDDSDNITGDVIKEMDNRHYDVRLLEDLRMKKKIYLRPDIQDVFKREVNEIDRMAALLDERCKKMDKGHAGIREDECARDSDAKGKTAARKEEKIERQDAGIGDAAKKKELHLPNLEKETKADRTVLKKDAVKKGGLTKEDEERVLDFIERWLKAWEGDDIDAYIGFYSPSFKSSTNMDIEAWKKYKASLNKMDTGRRISISDVKVSRKSGRLFVSFTQEYRDDNKISVGIKNLQIADDDLKIIYEEWKLLPQP